MKNPKFELKKKDQSIKLIRSNKQTISKLHNKFRETKKYENTCSKAVMKIPQCTTYGCTRVPACGRRTVYTE